MDKSDLCPHRPGFSQQSFEHRGLSVEINQIGSEMVDGYWNGKTIANAFWRAYITDRAGVSLTHNEQSLPYAPEAVTVIPAWVPFVFHTADDVGHAYVHFTLADVPGDLQRQLFHTPFALHDLQLRDTFGSFARDLVLNPTDPLLGIRAQGLAQHVIIAAFTGLNEAQRRQLQHTQQGRGRLAKALYFIDQHLATSIAVADLAEVLQVGNAHCIRLFKRHLGQTPAQYILDRRLERAAARISNGSDSLDNVAAAVGLGDRRYLARVFRKRLGMSPRAYRVSGFMSPQGVVTTKRVVETT